MLTKELKFTGKHAQIIRKYSQSRNATEQISRVKYLSYKEKKPKEDDLIIFDTYFHCFITSALLGIQRKKKVKMDTDSSVDASIFAEILLKNSILIKKLYSYYIFIKSDKKNIDENIRKAFSPNPSLDELALFTKDITEYACGGLEIIEDLFQETHNIEDILISFNELILN
jgi:hypothetical protein